MGMEELREELLSDFSFQKPRVLVTDRFAVVDHVKKLLLVSGESVVAGCGSFCAEVTGEKLMIECLADGRMEVRGEVRGVQIYPEQKRGGKAV
ncbi:MAG: hypothetical protein E7223_07540 [Clostridiales bacterium]|nr:hypothetical protein [Clostridiales bacterium]